MNLITDMAIIIVALLHIYFLVLEMFLWEKPIGLKIFGNSKSKAEITKVLAANQGLYNGFIAAGLLWGVFQGASGYDFKIFFTSCVIVAGVYGAITASKKILYVQAFPGAVSLALILFL